MIAEHRHLVTQGAKLVELRLDYINGQVNLKRLLGERPCPVVIAIRREADGGKWRGTEDERQMLLRAAIVDGVDYVDLEEDAAAAIRRYGKTKRIISHHDFRQTPDDLTAIYNRLAALDADVIKIATMANSPHDNLADAADGGGSKNSDRGRVHGRFGHALADFVRALRLAVHLCLVPSRAAHGAGAVELRPDDECLSITIRSTARRRSTA